MCSTCLGVNGVPLLSIVFAKPAGRSNPTRGRAEGSSKPEYIISLSPIGGGPPLKPPYPPSQFGRMLMEIVWFCIATFDCSLNRAWIS